MINNNPILNHSRIDVQNGEKENRHEKDSSMAITIQQLQLQDPQFMRLNHSQLISNNRQQLHHLVLLIVGIVINRTIHIMELFYRQHHHRTVLLHINIPRTIIKCLLRYDLTTMARHHEQMVF